MKPDQSTAPLDVPANGPRRRLRDRLAEREGIANPGLHGRHELTNLLLLVDDDLRQTARGLGAVDAFLAAAADLLERDGVEASDLASLAGDGDVLDHLDELQENVAGLRRKLLAIASQIR
jgi:hypothetical protein